MTIMQTSNKNSSTNKISNDEPREIKDEAIGRVNSWGKYFQENTLKIALSLMLFLGGLLVLIYFVQIEFLPEIDIANATTLLVSVALVGLLSVLALAVVFIAPGMILHHLLEEGFFKSLAPNSKVWSVESIVDSKELTALAETKSKQIPYSIHRSLRNYSIMASGVAALLQILVLRFFDTLEGWGIGNPYSCFFIGAIVLFFCALVILYRGRTRSAVETTPDITIKMSWMKRAINGEFFSVESISFTGLLGLWIIVGAGPLLPFAAAYNGPDGFWGWFLLGAWLFWIGIANSIWGCDRQGIKWWLVCAIALFSLYVLVIMTSNPSFVSTSALRKLGLGGLNGVTLVISKQACQAIAISTGEKTCNPEEKSEFYITEKVNLLSRMGSQYLIEGCSDNGMVRIVLNKTDVLSWSRHVDEQGASIDKIALDCSHRTASTEQGKDSPKSSKIPKE